jgi:hypothetical protein
MEFFLKNPNFLNIMKNAVSGIWCHVGLVRTDVSEERVASIFRVEIIHKEGAA